MAASTVHWLMLEETTFIRAMGAWRTVRDHRNAERNSGNSDRNGATHWMNTYSLMPRVRARAIRLSTKGWATKKRMAPPPRNIPTMAAPRTPGRRPITCRGT